MAAPDDTRTRADTACEHRSPVGRGYLVALAGVVLWSWTGIFIAYLFRHHALAPLTLAFWRDLFVALALLGGLAALRPMALRLERRDLRVLLLYGLSMISMNVSWTWSVGRNGAAVSTVLVYASPGITAVTARFLFGERLSLVRVLAFAASLAGCVLVARANDPAQWNLNAAGILVGLVSALAFTAYSLMGKVISRRGTDPWSATLFGFALAAVVLLPGAILMLPSSGPAASLLSLGTRWDGWAILVLLVVPTIGGYGLYTVSLNYLPTGTANLIATLEPVLTTLWAYLLLGESLNPQQLLGGVLIAGSVVSLRLEER
jgi:drug/metabolite transporter, DME family